MTDFAMRRTIMVDSQVRPSDVTKFPIIEAMLAVPRELYVTTAQRETAYVGDNIELAPGRVMLEPRTLAKMLDAVNIQPDERVLDVGAGSGYSTAVIARIAAQVVAVEDQENLAAAAQDTLDAQAVTNATVIHGPLAAGCASHGPYDVIMVQGAADLLPDGLTVQLRDGGRIACLFMEDALGLCRIGTMSGGQVAWRFAFNASAPVIPAFARPPVFML